MRVLSTRTPADGLKRRRYEADDGTRVTTIEVPIEQWVAATRARSRAVPCASRPCAEQMLRDGNQPKVVAFLLNMDEGTVRRWKRELRS